MIEIAGLVIDPAVIDHPLLGPAHVIAHAGAPITAMSAIDWDRPTQIPAIAEPRKLPAGAGTQVLNEIAVRAQAANVPALRYAGPYPTHSLYRSLLRSFVPSGDEEAFTADALGRALRLDRTEIPIDFRPAPYVRKQTSFGFVDVRSYVQRAMIHGVLYEDIPEGSLAHLKANQGTHIATIGLDHSFTLSVIAEIDKEGNLITGPAVIPRFAVPPAPGDVFPLDLAGELAELATEYVPEPLAADVQKLIATRPIRWADLHERAAKRTDDGFALHVAFLALAKRDMARFAELLSYHLARIAQAAVLDEVVASRRSP